MELPEEITVEASLTREDWLAYLRAYRNRQRAKFHHRPARYFILVMVGGLAAALALGSSVVRDGTPAFLTGVFMMLAVVWISALVQRRVGQPEEDGSFLGPVTFHFGPAGIRTIRRYARSEIAWPQVHSIEATASHLFLWLDTTAAFVLPGRSLPAGMDLRAAVAAMQALAKASGHDVSTGDPIAASSPDADGAHERAIESDGVEGVTVRRELSALGRLLLLRPADSAAIQGRDVSLLALLLLVVGCWIGLDRLRFDGDVEFFSWGLPVIAWYILGLMLVAWLVTRLCRPTPRYSRVMLLLAPTLLVLLAGNAAHEIFDGRWGAALCAGLVTVAYLATYLRRALRAIGNVSGSRPVLAGIPALFALHWISVHLYLDASAWVTSGTPFAEASYSRSEELLFKQPERIDAALARIAPADPARPDLFFVGFAGMGEQRVFAGEIGLAQRVIGQRYGSAARSILLVNDQRDLDRYPLATVTGLARALRGLAQRMDVEQDILFLSLSSHGSGAPSLEVSNGGLPLEQLTGENLRAALDDAGIRWRVIVISACHSGAFIKPLRNDRTIVITAARADRSSFGCADDRDVTDFGAAFYRDALPHAATLRSAFLAARAEVARQERQDGRSASDPQAFFGPEMEAQLASLESPSR